MPTSTDLSSTASEPRLGRGFAPTLAPDDAVAATAAALQPRLAQAHHANALDAAAAEARAAAAAAVPAEAC